MAIAGIEIRGIEALRTVLAQLADQAPHKMGGALFRQANFIMKEAKEQTPVDTGVLRASGHVDEPMIQGSKVSVQLGFGGVAEAYAIPVHENLTARHPVGNAKYLENPMLAATGELEAKLAADLQLDVRR